MVKYPLVISAVAVSIMLAASCWFQYHSTQGPVVFRTAGSDAPIVEAPRIVVLWLIPTIVGVGSAVMAILPRLSSRDQLMSSAAPYAANWAAGAIAFMAIQLCLLAVAQGVPMNMTAVMAAIVAMTLLVSGNFYSKVRYDYPFGLRTPWTLASDRVWDKTHRLVARLLVVSGLFLLLLALATPNVGVLAILIGVCSLVPMISGVAYSAMAARKAARP